MNFLESVKIALQQLASNKLRSILSLTGILIAVGAVTGIVSLGDGLQRSIYREFEQMGGFTTIWSYAPSPWYRDSSGNFVRQTWEEHLTFHDIDAIRAETDRIDYILANNTASYPITQGDVSLTGIQVVFSGPELLMSENLSVASGRFLSARDLVNRAKVVVIGWEMALNLFGNINPIGREVKIQGMRYTVVGVTDKKEFFGNNYDRAIVPITTGLQRFAGNDYLGYIVVKAKSLEDVDQVAASMRRVYRRIHEHGNEIVIRTGVEEMAEINQVLLIMKLIAGGIAGISLLVGGIGIMNIMLVSVTERTREIGIRKALGAKNANILWQFMVEAVVLCMFGGLLGVGFGILIGQSLSAFITSQTNMPFISVLSPQMIGLAVGFSFFVGITFGVYPAWKASRMDPVEALRKE